MANVADGSSRLTHIRVYWYVPYMQYIYSTLYSKLFMTGTFSVRQFHKDFVAAVDAWVFYYNQSLIYLSN
jgi:hypothetical protein